MHPTTHHRTLTPLTPQALADKLSGGGWEVSKVKGRPYIGRSAAVTKTVIKHNKICIRTAERTFVVNPHHILESEPWEVKLLHSLRRKRVRRKSDGGEQPPMQAALILRNRKLEEHHTDERTRAALAELEERRQSIAETLNRQYAGKKLAQIVVRVGELELVFEDGSKLPVRIESDVSRAAGLL